MLKVRRKVLFVILLTSSDNQHRAEQFSREFLHYSQILAIDFLETFFHLIFADIRLIFFRYELIFLALNLSFFHVFFAAF